MRDILDVIDKMIKQVPDDNDSLKSKLDKIRVRASYHAPEDRLRDWNCLSFELNNMLPYPPETEWQKKIFRIMKGR